MKIVGTTTNRDAGLDIFCQDGSQTNQLNSYYIAIKPGENKIQIIEFNNNVSNLRAEAICTILSATQYDFKVIYDPTNGEINVYQNDIFLLSWIDSTPLTSGNQVSFRTTSCAASFDDFRVFKSRNSTAMVTVGNASTKEIRYQNPNLTTNTGKITSITTDIAKNISTEKSNEFKVDFWGPYVITNVNDGLSTDISSQESLTTISANWLATTDPNNTVTWYSYAIGTSPGASNILTWTNNGMNLSFTKSGLNLVNGSTYYVSIKSTNASGLSSTAKSSNGVLVSKSKTMINEAIKEQYNLTENPISLYPNPVSDYLQITNIDKRIQYKIYDINDHIMCNDFINDEFKIDVSNLKNGVYFIEILIDDSNLIRRFIKI